MSKFSEIATRKDGIQGGKPSWFDSLFAIAPEVACVLSGSPGDPPDVPPTLPHSIILSDRKGTLQFCISRQDSPDMWFGQIEDAKAIISEIEARIAFNELTYQEKREKRGSYRPS